MVTPGAEHLDNYTPAPGRRSAESNHQRMHQFGSESSPVRRSFPVRGMTFLKFLDHKIYDSIAF